jgi:hypothetical protein
MNSPLCDTLLAMYADLPSGGLAILYMACGASWFMIVAAAPRAVASARVTMPNARRCAPVFPSLLPAEGCRAAPLLPSHIHSISIALLQAAAHG